MSKQKHRLKIGQQQHKPFPVVEMQFRPVDFGETVPLCACTPCKNLVPDARALFLMRPFADIGEKTMLGGQFTKQERAELLWEKAYRSQLRNEAEPEKGFPICAQCAVYYIAQFLGHDKEQDATAAIAASVSAGKDIILFDRNLSRDRTYPTLALCFFSSVQSFRKQYYEAV